MNVLNDADGEERIEVETDGSIVKIGRDVENDRCLTFNYENFHDTIVSQIRHHSGSSNTFSTSPEQYTTQSYCIWRPNFCEYRLFRGTECVLVMKDHEAGPLYTAHGIAHDLREDDYDYEDIAESWVEAHAPALLEIDHMGVTKRDDEVHITLREEDPVCVNMGFVEMLREGDETDDDVGIYLEEGDLRYKFTLYADEVDDA